MLHLFLPDALTRSILSCAHSLPVFALLLSHLLVASPILSQALVEILLVLLELFLKLIVFPLLPSLIKLLFSLQSFLLLGESRRCLDLFDFGSKGFSLRILSVNDQLLGIFLSLT